MGEALSLPWSIAPSKLYLCSRLCADYGRELEDLFFFNPKQHLVRGRVEEHVERYGKPVIICSRGYISLQLSTTQDAQSLFIMMDDGRAKLIGVMVYVREQATLKVLYLALKSNYTLTWDASGEVLAFVVGALKKVASSVNGIREVRIAITNREAVFQV